MSDRVPVAPFRERFERLAEREELTLAELASRMGWINARRGTPDIQRSQRVLGLVQHGKSYRQYVDYELAIRLCDALDLDYFEAGV
jgi:transcriptional regulator with XRE-family HTH domain